VGNATRGKGGGGKKPGTKVAKKGGGGGGGGSTALTESKPRHPGIGLTYQTFRAGGAALAPVTEAVTLAAHPAASRSLSAMTTRGINLLKARPSDIIIHEVVVVADVAVDKKMGQAAAISRGSVSAILPEVYAGWRAWTDPSISAVTLLSEKINRAHREALKIEYGYNVGNNTGAYSDPRFRTYRLGKHGGQAFRWLRGRRQGKNLIHRATEPLQKVLSMVGGTI